MTAFPYLSLRGAKQACRERSVAEAIEKCCHLKQNRSSSTITQNVLTFIALNM